MHRPIETTFPLRLNDVLPQQCSTLVHSRLKLVSGTFLARMKALANLSSTSGAVDSRSIPLTRKELASVFDFVSTRRFNLYALETCGGSIRDAGNP